MLFRESESVELKREVTADLKKEIVAFANSSGGTIYIGVEDDGTPCGVKDPSRLQQQISSMIHDSIRPDLTLFISATVREYNGAQLLELSVQRGTDRPYYIKDKGLRPSGVYIRLGSASQYLQAKRPSAQ